MKRAWYFLCIISLLSVLVSATEFNIQIRESGTVLDYYGEYFIVNLVGNFTMYNLYDIPLYGIKIPFNPSTLAVVDRDNSNMIRGNSIRIPLLEANSSAGFNYFIYGIASEDPFEGIYHGEQSALRDLIENVSITAYSDMIISLKKGEIEPEGNNRALEVRITNPTSLEYIINNMRIIKTPDEDVNNEIYHLDIPEKTVLYANEEWTKFVRDTNTGLKEEDVYWFFVDMTPQNFNVSFDDYVDLDLLTEGDIEKYPKEGTVVPEVGEVVPTAGLPRVRVFLRKTADPTRIFPGDKINVTLIVTNLEQQSKVITLDDTISDGFELTSASSDYIQTGRTLQWIVEVNKDTSKLVSYVLTFVDNNSIGLDYLPAATAYYDNKKVLSPKVPIIKKFVPKKRIYLQKSINQLAFDRMKVTIVVRNMGETNLYDLILKEYFEPDAEFSEITISPRSKGLWEIPELEISKDWIVSYRTNNHRFLENLPSLYGIDDIYVLKTLVRENIVSRYVLIPGVNIIEFVGIVVVILFPIVFIYLLRLRKKLENLEP